ncbi:MAG: antitoxin Xre/MbcA/ParS toxin-binding domain-containing protein [Candidatus Caldatribacteriota bacterium]|nr:antitoxin Xre/MbcA/ParS toxin-binding domain-containing protein [Candidatus Caldatribacteriota bacterium]
MASKTINIKYEKNKNVASLRKKYHCSQTLWARMIGISEKTVSRWETNKSSPSALASNKIKEFEKILDKMKGVIRRGKEGEWLNTPNDELNNNTPLETILKGSEGVQEVINLLCKIEWGVPV